MGVNACRLAGPTARLALIAALSTAAPAALHAATAGTPLRGTPVRPSAASSGKPGAARSSVASDARAALPPLTVDSLAHDKLPRGGFIVASDVNQLTRLRREVEYGTNQFRRYMGLYPAPVKVAAVGDLDPARIDEAVLRAGGVEHVVTDWPEPRKPGVTPNSWISDRVARWSLEGYENAKGTGRPPEGHSRLTPDWFAAAIEGLATPPTEQNRRVEWMRGHLEQHIPLARFLEMSRPAAGAGDVAGTDTHPGPSPPVRVRATNGAVRAPARRAAAGPSDELFDAQALAFAKFLVFREDERFLGLWYEFILRGEPQSAAFNTAKTMLSSSDAMEKEWLAWMKNPDQPPPPRVTD